MFLIGIIFFISFCSNLSITFIDKIICLKSNSSIYLLIINSLFFSSLTFISIKSFSNFKRLILTFKNWFFRKLFKYFFSIFLFYNLDFSSLYINEKNFKILKIKKIIFQTISTDFKWLKLTPITYITHIIYITQITYMTYILKLSFEAYKKIFFIIFFFI